MIERQDYQGEELYSQEERAQEERVEQAQRAMVSFVEGIQALAEANKALLEDNGRTWQTLVVC
jgi:hypothetical protein